MPTDNADPALDRQPAEIRAAIAEVLETDLLRPGQAEAIEAARGGDTLAVLATGTGKTLIYRVMGRLRGPTTVVVSPTLSLQSDQLMALHAAGPSALALNSLASAAQQRRTIEQIAGGKVGFVLLAPEQLGKPDVVAALARAGVSQFVVDEAHCVVSWGHDFRPDYLALAGVIAQLGAPPVLALTATASAQMRTEITDALGLRDARVVVGEVDRPNVWLGARLTVDEAAADAATLELVEESATDGAILVYVATRQRAESLAQLAGGADQRAAAYHAALPRRVRDRVHAGFKDGSIRTVVATTAFALGVDRSDVRLVVHADPPESLEGAYQQIGRAGRDGKPARAVLLDRPNGYRLPHLYAARQDADPTDLYRVAHALTARPQSQATLAEATGLNRSRVRRCLNVLTAVGAIIESRSGVRACPTADDELIGKALEAGRQRQARQETAVELVRRYAETTDCRRRLILQLLGETVLDPCGHCDSCDAGTATVTRPGRFALGTAVRHAHWGRGIVEQLEGEYIVVLFDHAGHRALSTDVVEEKGLLTLD